MNFLRDSLASIPGALNQCIADTISVASNNVPIRTGAAQGQNESNSTGSETESISTVTGFISDKSLPIPASLVKEQWRLIFTSDDSEQDLTEAINHCKDLVLLSEENSDERRWLVRHLIDLRYALQEIEEAKNEKVEVCSSVRTIVGHHFIPRQRGVGKGLPLPSAFQYCDRCTGIIWSVVQASYQCSDCCYIVHQKCIDNVVRICTHVIASERQYPILDICPEVGLAAQRYECIECSKPLHFKNSWIEPRLCDYTGFYYCPWCHWNDMSVIPARIVHNWDFAPRRVSRSGLQEINLFLDKPVIRLEDVNPKLFVFLEKLATLKKLRQNLIYMRKYLSECRQAVDNKLVESQIGTRRHLIQSNEFYSINDMKQAESGALAEFLYKLYNCFDKHIRNCLLCTAKAYICEICSNNEAIFPFDDGCIICDKCNSMFHRVCMTRKNMICPKCARIQKRYLQRELGVENRKTSSDASKSNY